MAATILEMHKHPDGFLVATVRSHYNQEEYTLHTRWGSWLVGNPDIKHEVVREPATLARGLQFDLQDYRVKHKIDDLPEPEPEKVNPFIALAERKASQEIVVGVDFGGDPPGVVIQPKPEESPDLVTERDQNVRFEKQVAEEYGIGHPERTPEAMPHSVEDKLKKSLANPFRQKSPRKRR